MILLGFKLRFRFTLVMAQSLTVFSNWFETDFHASEELHFLGRVVFLYLTEIQRCSPFWAGIDEWLWFEPAFSVVLSSITFLFSSKRV